MKGWAASVALAVTLSASAGCGDGTHAFLAQRYDPEKKCLAQVQALDVIAGEPPGDCSVVCLVRIATPSSPEEIYVSSMCPPYPPALETSGRGAACVEALDARARGVTCTAGK